MSDVSCGAWAPADLNGDGNLDVALANPNIKTSFGAHNGVFAFTNTAVPSASNAIAGVADFNGDGRDDLVTFTGNGGLHVFLGSSVTASGIDPASTFTFGGSGFLVAAVTADFNGDGKPDVAVASSAGVVSVGFNNGAGFVAGPVLATGSSLTQLAAFDVDGQSGPDLLASNPGAGTLRLATNGGGSFTLQPVTTIPATTSEIIPYREAGTTFVVLRAGVGALQVASLSSDGVLGTPATISPNSYASIAVGDLDGDGNVEVMGPQLTGKGTIDVYQHDPSTWQLRQTLRPNNQPVQVRLVDWNGDGKLDLSYCNGPSEATLDVIPNLGTGLFLTTPQYALDAAPISGGAFGDLDGDGLPDAVVPVDSLANQRFVDVYLADVSGGFTNTDHVSIPQSASIATIKDVTGDGNADVVITRLSNIELLAGDGAGHLTVGPHFVGPSDQSKLAIADLDGDGQDDLAVAAPGGIRIYGPTGGFFGGTAHLATSSAWPEVQAIVDVDGDGLLDLVVSGSFDQAAAWAPNQGGFTFGAPQPILSAGIVRAVSPLQMGALPRRWLLSRPDGLHDFTETTNGPIDVIVGGAEGTRITQTDWNHDGLPDAIVSGTVVSLNQGVVGGGYAWSGLTLLGGGRERAAAIFDATGDANQDLVFINHYGGITVLPAIP